MAKDDEMVPMFHKVIPTALEFALELTIMPGKANVPDLTIIRPRFNVSSDP